MDFVYNGKPIMPTKTAMNELNEINLDLYGVVEILEKGFQLRKILLKKRLERAGK